MTWTPIRGENPRSSQLPAKRGRYLIRVGKPLLDETKPRWLHFSWLDESFCIRDFVMGRERRQEAGLTASDVWRMAIDRQPATGRYYFPVERTEEWAKALRELDEQSS